MLAIVKTGWTRLTQLLAGQPAAPAVDPDGNLWVRGVVSSGGITAGPVLHLDAPLVPGFRADGAPFAIPPGHTHAFVIVEYTRAFGSPDGASFAVLLARGDGAALADDTFPNWPRMPEPPDYVVAHGGRFAFWFDVSHGEREITIGFYETGLEGGPVHHVQAWISTR